MQSISQNTKIKTHKVSTPATKGAGRCVSCREPGWFQPHEGPIGQKGLFFTIVDQILLDFDIAYQKTRGS